MNTRWRCFLNIKYTLAILLFLVGCSQSNEIGESVSVTAQPVATTQIPNTPIPVTPTFALTPTFEPSPIINKTETPGFNSFALNNVAVQERGGVVVEIVWIMVGDKQVLIQDESENININSNSFADKPVVAWIIFNITNNSEKEIHLHPRRGSVIINDEHINLSEYKTYTSVNEKFDGAYSPGEKVIGGGVWFGIQDSEVSEINQMIVMMHGPHFPEEGYYAEDYYFALDLSNHALEEFPDYLK